MPIERRALTCPGVGLALARPALIAFGADRAASPSPAIAAHAATDLWRLLAN